MAIALSGTWTWSTALRNNICKTGGRNKTGRHTLQNPFLASCQRSSSKPRFVCRPLNQRGRANRLLIRSESPASGSTVEGVGSTSAVLERDAEIKVTVSNSESELWTMIQVETLNRPGILQKITSTFRDLDLQVMRALVDTVGDSVIDKFFVVDAAGHKLEEDGDALQLVKERLEQLAIAAPSALPPATAIRPVIGAISAIEEMHKDGSTGEGVAGEGVPSDKDEQARLQLIHRLKDMYIRNDVLSVQESIVNHVEYTIARSRYSFDDYEAYHAVAHSVRDRLIESWNDTEQHFQEVNPKRVYYLSMEFLMGRSLLNSLYNLGVHGIYVEALKQLGYDLETLVEQERDAALGNGGLGRLAACFLDSMASLNYPAWGYGIRYQYGMFRQTLQDGFQHEQPDYWLTFGNPWEIERVHVTYTIQFYGHVETYQDENSRQRFKWVPGEQVEAVAYDNPVPGYGTNNTINLRLWAGKPSVIFDLQSFNTGDYVSAILAKQRAETISSVLYPDDRTYQGKELRLKQQHFFVSASLQDIVARFLEKESDLTKLPTKVALQLNDTHPTIGIPELMRILLDDHGLGWTKSWAIVSQVFAYTNHTVLPEALEKWPVTLVERLLPRHMQIIYQINFNFIQSIKQQVGDDFGKLSRLSIIEEGDVKNIRMANLALVASHTVNGVAAIHSELIKHTILKDFFQLWPHKFQNKTNGVTQRRWLAFCNPGLRRLIDETLGSDGWITDLTALEALKDKADDEEFQSKWMQVKLENKKKLARLIEKEKGIKVDTSALFDIQVKRIHEYKRQLLNILAVIHRYEIIKRMSAEEKANVVPRVVIFGGKAAPGYEMAKRIIKLVSAVGEVVNKDTAVGDLLKVVFLADYNVSLAETIIPASDLSQHISTAGTEASGTSNMKFSMNGGLIIGTMDGANVEIREEIGEENIFIFGALADEVPRLRAERRNFRPDARFNNVVNLVRNGAFGWTEYFTPLMESLNGAMGGDFYLLANDFPSYLDTQAKVDEAWRDKKGWARMSILSTAGCAKFSSDRTIDDYAREIWNVEPVKIPGSRQPSSIPALGIEA